MNNPDEFIGQIRNPPPAFRPVAFWFLNHRLEADELVRQVNEMADKGMGGFMTHARDGLRTGYLKEDWAVALKTAMEAAEKNAMQVWLYDENHYPSGPAGNQLAFRFPDRTMKSLAVCHEKVLAPGDEWLIVNSRHQGLNMTIAASLETPQTRDLSALLDKGRRSWHAPKAWGPTLILSLEEKPWQARPSDVFSFFPDYFDPDLTDNFIRLTHQWYFDRFKKQFGRTIKGIFSDNSCAHFGHIRRATPWGKDFERRFHAATGLNLRALLPGVFCSSVPNAGLARLIFWRFVGQTYLGAYFKRIRAFCNRVGLLSTGHLCLEEGMGEHVRQIGDYFEVMRSFSLTAVDQLGPKQAGAPIFDSCGENLPACIKNTASAARFQGSARVMCESFGLASGPWSLDLFEIRRISGWLATVGVDLVVPHGLYYSIAGGRKWECTPDHFHNPLWGYYRVWTDWIARLCLASAGGTNLAEVAVLYPIHSLRAGLELGRQSQESKSARETFASTAGIFRPLPDSQGGWPVSDRGTVTDFIEATYLWTVTTLLWEHIDFEVADEEILCRAGKIGDGSFHLPAPGRPKGRAFKVLVLPAVTVLEKRTANIIKKLLKAGVQVILLNARPVFLFDPDRNKMEPCALFGAPDDKTFKPGHDDFRTVVEYDREKIRALNIRPVDANTAGREGLVSALVSKVAPSILVTGEVQERGQLVTRAWEKNGMRFYLIFNSGSQATSGRVQVREQSPLVQIDLDSGDIKSWDKSEFDWTFEPAQALLLASGLNAEPPQVTAARPSALIRTIPLTESWVFSAPYNSLPLRQWQVKVAGREQIYSMSFQSRLDLPPCRLLMDQERSTPELDGTSYARRFRCFLNGAEVGNFQPGTILDRNIYEAELNRTPVRRGNNVLEIKTCAGLSEWEYRLWPPIIVGAFKVIVADDGRPTLDAPATTLPTGSWVEHGYPFFAGEGVYSRNINLPSLLPEESLYLDLGNVAFACRVNFNGQPAGGRIAPPWRVALTPWAGQTGKLNIHVANTPHNLFMESPHPAGLLGPVSLWIVK